MPRVKARRFACWLRSMPSKSSTRLRSGKSVWKSLLLLVSQTCLAFAGLGSVPEPSSVVKRGPLTKLLCFFWWPRTAERRAIALHELCLECAHRLFRKPCSLRSLREPELAWRSLSRGTPGQDLECCTGEPFLCIQLRSNLRTLKKAQFFLSANGTARPAVATVPEIPASLLVRRLAL